MSDQLSIEESMLAASQFQISRGIPSLTEARGELSIPESDLGQLLHTSLEVEVVVRRFAQAVSAAIRHDGFRYRNPDLDIDFGSGRETRHECRYRLMLHGEALGEILFRRGRRFPERDLEKLESLLPHLLYPLRNALMYRKAMRAAQEDPLTGLYNRAAMARMLPREMAAARRSPDHHLALFMVDLDHFKRINDQLGHSIGDEVLQRVSDCLRMATRDSDLLFRCGGEEFVVLMHLSDLGMGNPLGHRMLDMIRNCRSVQDLVPGFAITASVGWAVARHDESDRQLFDRADRAMYMAKNSGRDCLIAAH